MKAGIISLAVTLCGMLANIISWYSSGHLLLAKTMYGGEIIEEFGFGIMAAHIYSMEPNGKGSVFMIMNNKAMDESQCGKCSGQNRLLI